MKIELAKILKHRNEKIYIWANSYTGRKISSTKSNSTSEETRDCKKKSGSMKAKAWKCQISVQK